MTRWTPLEKPTARPASLTLWLGWASLVPTLAPPASLLACIVGAVSHFLCARYPERYTGRPRIYLGLCLCLLGMILFFAEGALFMRWKVHQSYEQRLEVTQFRMNQIAQALERYREEKGAYPAVTGIMSLKETLEPHYLADCPVLDGFDRSISADSAPEGFTITCFPEAFRGMGSAPPPLVLKSSFQPAPAPPPPPLPEDANAAANAPAFAVPQAGTAPPAQLRSIPPVQPQPGGQEPAAPAR